MNTNGNGGGLPTIPESVRLKLSEIFSKGPFISHKDVAAFLNISETWLRELGNKGVIEFHRKGTCHRIYAREHIEKHLRREVELCQSTGRKTQKRASPARNIISMTSRSKSSAKARPNAFTAQQARKRAAQRKPTKTE